MCLFAVACRMYFNVSCCCHLVSFSAQGTLLNNYAHVFELLSRLRQAVDHPYLVVHGSFRGQEVQLPSKSAGAADVCGICTLDILDARDCAVNVCRHTFHRDCILEYADAGDDDTGGSQKGKGKRKNTKVVFRYYHCFCFVFVSLCYNIGYMDGSIETLAHVLTVTLAWYTVLFRSWTSNRPASNAQCAFSLCKSHWIYEALVTRMTRVPRRVAQPSHPPPHPNVARLRMPPSRQARHQLVRVPMTQPVQVAKTRHALCAWRTNVMRY